MDVVALSKIVSFALRHKPEEYGLVLDQNGWADIDDLLFSIHKKHPQYALISHKDLASMISSDTKKRHELNERKIRALYGHTIKNIIKKNSTEPPCVLYHGTSSKNVDLIKKEGLKKMERQYVHLSSDPIQAVRVAARKTKTPVLLTIRAKDAFLRGVEFCTEGNVWLCAFVPNEFIEVSVK